MDRMDELRKRWKEREKELEDIYRVLQAYYEVKRMEEAERGRKIAEAIDELESLLTELNTKREEFLRQFVGYALLSVLEQGKDWFDSFVETMDRLIQALEKAESRRASDFRRRLDGLREK